MAKFKYVAKDSAGAKKKGSVEADTENEARANYGSSEADNRMES